MRSSPRCGCPRPRPGTSVATRSCGPGRPSISRSSPCPSRARATPRARSRPRASSWARSAASRARCRALPRSWPAIAPRPSCSTRWARRRIEYNPSRDLGMCWGGVMSVFFERVALPSRLVVLGAGHIARPLVAIASAVGFRVVVVDEREEWAAGERFPDAAAIHVDDPQAVVAELALDAETAVVGGTHHHPLDQALVRALVASRAGVCGLAGSEA